MYKKISNYSHKRSKNNFSVLYKYTTAAVIIWVLFIAGTIRWNIYSERNHTIEMARIEARSAYNKDLALRLWAASHGGVYVSPDEKTPPNPYLSHIPGRDVITTSGKKLTLMNPAYILRQAMGEYEKLFGVKGHIASLKVLNPVNTPNDWEHKALIEFERGVEEISEIVEVDGNKFMSLMHSVITEEACLKCHEHQGYKVGDVHGGIGVSIPMEPYFVVQQDNINNYLLTNSTIFLIGLFVIGFVSYRSKQRRIEKRQAKINLQESEERFRAIAESSLDAIIAADDDRKIIYWNKAASDIYGYEAQEILGQSASTLMTSDNARLEQKERRKFNEAKNGPFFKEPFESIAVKKDGTEFPVEISLSSWKVNECVFISSIIRDITARKRTEKRIHESEERYRLLVENQNDLVLKFDANQKILYVSPTYCQTFGAKEEDLIGKSFSPLIHKDDLGIVEASIDSLKKPPHISSHEERTKTIDGLRWFSWSLRAGVDNVGNILEVIAVGRDISERKQVEMQLKRNEKLLNTTQQLARIGGWEIDLEKDRTFWTDEVYRIHDLEPKEFTSTDKAVKVSLRCYDSKDLPVIMDAFNKCAEKGQPYDLEFPFTTTKGCRKWIRTIASPMLVGDRIIKVVGYFMDITERKQLEDNLRQGQKMEAVGTLAGGIAHDFNNILGGILGYTELAQDEISQNSPVQEYFSEILISTTRAKNLVRQILTFSRKEQEDKKPILLYSIVNEAVNLLRSIIPTTIEIRQNIDDKVGMVNGNSTQIHQVVMNLCTNAAHAMDESGGVLGIVLSRVAITQESMGKYHNVPPGSFLELKISDTGRGIEPKIIHRIFEPFFTTKGKEKGTGMGLALVHGIVKNHGGDIIVDSQLGKGTTIKVLLPQDVAKPVKEEKNQKTAHGGKEHILLVDDEKKLMNLGEKMLASKGYKVTAMDSSIEALEAFRQAPDSFDMVITDQAMPNITGYNLSKRILKIKPSIKIIICTGYYSEAFTQERLVTAGVMKLMYKPFSKNILIRTVREVLDKKD